jgi:molecular chaperone GrpE
MLRDLCQLVTVKGLAELLFNIFYTLKNRKFTLYYHKILMEQEDKEKKQENVLERQEEPEILSSGGDEVSAEEKQDSKGKKKHKKTSDKEVEKLHAENAELKDKYLRLYSEFENFRRRTFREKLDMSKTANEELMVSLLPVIDDFERAMQYSENEPQNNHSIKEGVLLIYNKLRYITELKGLKTMNLEKGAPFNPEFHEAISQLPVEEENQKGKIIEVIEKGYLLHDKVIRYAKVITGS